MKNETYSNVIETIYLGADHGYKALKDSENNVLMSSVKVGRKTAGAKDAFEVQLEGKYYTVSKVTTREGKLLTGINKLESEDNKEILKVQTLASIYLSSKNPSAGVLEVNYCFGLPISSFVNQVDEFEKFILNECNNVSVSVDGGGFKTIKIKNVTAIPQSAGVPFLLENEFKNTDMSAVVDLGHYTVDVAIFDGMNLRAGAKSFPKGAKDVFGDLADLLTETTGKMFTADDMEQVIIRGKVVNSKGEDVYLEGWTEFQEKISAYVNGIFGTIESQYSDVLQSSKIYFIGGLAAPFETAILNKFPKGKTKVITDARFANAQAYKEVAKLSFR